tara:strand:- start:32 stop:235 length:204 start_codon:yes stop_codon:yes gene_type:complete
MIKNFIILGLVAWLIYAIGVNQFFDNVRTTVDKVEELVNNKDKILLDADLDRIEEELKNDDNESEEE